MRNWLKKLIIEALRESSMCVSKHVISKRDPTALDHDFMCMSSWTCPTGTWRMMWVKDSLETLDKVVNPAATEDQQK